MTFDVQEIRLKGLPICRGIAIGKPFFFHFVEDSVPEFSIPEQDIEEEIVRYRLAINSSVEDLKFLQTEFEEERIFEGASILDAQLQILQDNLFTHHIENEIYRTHKNAEYVFHNLIKEYQVKFDALEDSFFRERFKDLQDIARRIMAHLRVSVRISLANIPPHSIIFSHELTASDAVEANISQVGAFVTETGGSTSHAAIVAKAKGTPYVTNVDFRNVITGDDCWIIVDGRTGEIIINPATETLEEYQRISKQLKTHLSSLIGMNNLPPETYDGYSVRLSANIEAANELEMLHSHGASGVGLFRSEYIFLTKEIFPPEEEQFEIYKSVVANMRGLPTVIRTFDLGGDKCFPNKQFSREINPFLGCRAIRFLLKEQEIFKTQLRAILRASAYGEVSIMFPMVSTLSELIEAKSIVNEVKYELAQRGEKIGQDIKIGCMIEVPSAAIIADLLAQECDFLSIGTNDLIQYSLAVDRGNQALSALYTPTHPSVIRLIKLIVNEANHRGIPVTVCGEVAADPRFTALLLGLGVHELSVSTRYIPTVKHAIRNTSIVAASHLAEKVLSLRTAAEIQALLVEEYKENVPEDFYYNC